MEGGWIAREGQLRQASGWQRAHPQRSNQRRGGVGGGGEVLMTPPNLGGLNKKKLLTTIGGTEASRLARIGQRRQGRGRVWEGRLARVGGKEDHWVRMASWFAPTLEGRMGLRREEAGRQRERKRKQRMSSSGRWDRKL